MCDSQQNDGQASTAERWYLKVLMRRETSASGIPAGFQVIIDTAVDGRPALRSFEQAGVAFYDISYRMAGADADSKLVLNAGMVLGIGLQRKPEQSAETAPAEAAK